MLEVLFVVSVVGGALALALATGFFLAGRYGGRSLAKRRTITMGTIVVAILLAIAWVLVTGRGVCC